MFRIIAVTAMAALAAAQSEFSANDGSINVETREGENKVFISIPLFFGSNPTHLLLQLGRAVSHS